MTDVIDQIEQIDARQSGGASGRAFAFVEKWLGNAKRIITQHRERLKPILLMGALALFCAGLFLSLREYPVAIQQIWFLPLAILLFGSLPIGLAINAIDFQMLARLSGVKVNFWQSLITTIYMRAANMLPIPGSMAVRMAVLKSNGVTFRKSGTLMFIFTAIWGGVGFWFSAIWLFIHGNMSFFAAFAALGTCILAGCFVGIRHYEHDILIFIRVAGLRFALIVLEAFALLMAIHAIGADAGYQQTAILVVASFLASIVPAGIGVRETLIAGLSPIAGIDPAIGFLAAATVRITGITFLTICSVFVLSASKIQHFKIRK